MSRRQPGRRQRIGGHETLSHRPRGYWHRLLPVLSLVLIDVIFVFMLDEIFENKKDAIIRSDRNYFTRFYPHISAIRDDYDQHIGLRRANESAEEYQQRFVEHFRRKADQYISQSDFFYKLTIIGIHGDLVFERTNARRFRDLNTWRNCFISRDFSRTVTLHRDVFPESTKRPERMIIRIHYTSPQGWPEIERLVLRFWIYASVFVVITAIFYVWLDRRMIRPLARVAGRLEQLAAAGAAEAIRQPSADIEAAYNRLAESQRVLRVEMDLDRLIDRYERGEEIHSEEMGTWFLRDAAGIIGEAFELGSVVVLVPSTEPGGWECVGRWPADAPFYSDEEIPQELPSRGERVTTSQGSPAKWIIPLGTEHERMGLILLEERKEQPPDESIGRIRRLVENGLVRCASFSRRLAEERNRFGINLATSMGHDLTNIIASGKWDLRTIYRALSKDIVQLDPTKAKVFGRAVEGLKNNLQFLQEMVDIYRALGAARQPCYEEGDVGAHLKEVCSLFSLSTSQRIELVQEIADHCEGLVEPRLLKMAVFNLLVNAAHAIQARDDGLVGGKITVRLDRDGPDITLAVRDNGPGIRDQSGNLLDDREISRIFQSGYSTKGPGGGLGLVWVKSIVEEFHQGTIRARNLQEGGAEITIRFPPENPERLKDKTKEAPT